ncbi:hypothetical protein [Nonomuraea helvata]|uniref:Uncharacterized protein n=1 Tax=Nonomuraea helvata TaxID=37484 RepID=A0ABV5SIP0_9ACTN
MPPNARNAGGFERLDLPLERKNIENTRAKLKRLVSLGILVETELGHKPVACGVLVTRRRDQDFLFDG